MPRNQRREERAKNRLSRFVDRSAHRFLAIGSRVPAKFRMGPPAARKPAETRACQAAALRLGLGSDPKGVLMKARDSIRVLLLAGFCSVAGVALGATLESLTNQPPAYVGLGPPFLLTDGSVMFQDDSFTGWWKLTPDASGSYLDGTWSELASLPADWNYGPYAYASAVLADGRVLIEGGEYNLGGPFSLTNLGAIYDPAADSWAQVDPPPGWDFIGDSSSIVMPNGKFVLGDKLTMRIAELDPATMTWTDLGSSGKADFNAEEGWTLLPDGSFVTVDV